MAKTIETLKYPERLQEVVKDKDFLDAFRAFLEKKNVQFGYMLEFVDNPPAPGAVYDVYLAAGAPKELPVGGSLKAQVDKLTEAKDEADPKEWGKVVRGLEAQYSTVLNDKLLPNFFKADAFWEYHSSKIAEKVEATMGKPADVAKKLKIKNYKKLALVMDKAARGRLGEATNLATQLLKAEKSATAPKDLIKGLASGNFGTVKTEKDGKGKKSMNVTPATLEKCGFLTPKDKKLQSAVEDFGEAVFSGDMILTKKAQLKIQTFKLSEDAPKMSNLNKMIRAFVKAKIIQF